MMDGWNGGMGAFGWIVMTLFWLGLIGVVVWAVASLFPGRGRGEPRTAERPEEILDRRLASGELDPAAYDELRAKLRTARAERV